MLIGIDPGVATGYAEWDRQAGGFLAIKSMPIHLAMLRVQEHMTAGRIEGVAWEDARLRTWFGTKGAEALQGAGSIKRDCTIWSDYLAHLKCPRRAVKPQAGATKWDADTFRRVTGWPGRTNEHGRDAALLVWRLEHWIPEARK